MNGTSAQYCNLRTREGEILKIPFFPADQEAIDALIQHVQGSGAHHDGEAEDKREYTIHGRRNGKTAIFFALFLLLAGCKEVPVSESSEPLNSNNVIKWFDCLNGDEMAWDGVKEYDLDEFSGVTFRWHPERLEAVADGTTIPLYDGMPIWSVYFYDLTGDGNPELCSTISFGSGIIDDRIIIYDYAGGASYELSDRGNFDYVLNMQEDSLIVEKRAYMQDELIESGELVFLNDTIQIKTE